MLLPAAVWFETKDKECSLGTSLKESKERGWAAWAAWAVLGRLGCLGPAAWGQPPGVAFLGGSNVQHMCLDLWRCLVHALTGSPKKGL